MDYGPSQAQTGIGSLIAGFGAGYAGQRQAQNQLALQQAYADAMYGRQQLQNEGRTQVQGQRSATAEEVEDDRLKGVLAGAAAKAHGAVAGAAKANDWLSGVERELASAASVQQLGNKYNLWDTTPGNVTANAMLHAVNIPGAGALASSSLPAGAFDLNSQGENATIALAKALNGGRPSAQVVEMLRGHRAKIGGGTPQAGEAWDSTLGSARSIAEGELAKQFYNDPAGADNARQRLDAMFGDFRTGGRRAPFSNVTGKTGLTTSTAPSTDFSGGSTTDAAASTTPGVVAPAPGTNRHLSRIDALAPPPVK